MAFKTEFEFTLPKGYVDKEGEVHRRGVMRLATAKDEILPLQDYRVQNNRAYLVIILLSLLGYAVLITFSIRHGELFHYEPATFDIIILAISFAACIFYTQCANEYLGLRKFVMFLLAFWAFPFLLFLLLLAPSSDPMVPASYLSLTSPMTAGA